MKAIITKLHILIAVILTAAFVLCACAGDTQASDNTLTATPDASAQTDVTADGYRQMTAQEAVSLMESESGYIILDVRRQDEYDGGHIPGAVCVPNESIGEGDIPELPDKQQLILVYCRSGRRSKEAAQKLADMGYTNIVEFGGIIDWTGETVTSE